MPGDAGCIAFRPAEVPWEQVGHSVADAGQGGPLDATNRKFRGLTAVGLSLLPVTVWRPLLS
ncbi:MAG: hypothetical protein EBU59_06690 [Planctomycetia bacterium]|nr:hypothetical protein [Planctomycetia bacterium]